MNRDRLAWPFNEVLLRSLLLACFLIGALASRAAAQVIDPPDDNDSQADIVRVMADQAKDERGEAARIRLWYAQPPEPPLVGYIFIDLDRNHATMVPSISPLAGVDAVVKFQLASSTGSELKMQVDIITQSGTETIIPPKTTKLRLRISGNLISLILSPELLGGVSIFDLFVATDVGTVGDAEFDRVPDAGLIDYSTGTPQVKIPQPGDSSIDATLKDAVQDTIFPDLTAFQASVAGDRIRMMLSYNHDVTSGREFPAGSKIEGYVYMDTDHRLATGFTNGRESPPSLGVDFAVHFILDPRRPLETSLLSFNSRTPGRSAPNELKLGLAFFNDCMVKRSGKQLVFDLPLSLLGDSTGDMDVRVESIGRPLNTLDALPDGGSLALASRHIHSPFACTVPVVEIADGNDSPQGGKNDEMLGASACLSLNNDVNDDVLLLEIDYASLQPVQSSATTKIYLDVDQDPATGVAVSNSNTTIGADFILSYSINPAITRPEPVMNVQLMKAGGQPQIYNQLAAFTLGPMGAATVSLPLSLLGQDDGNMDIMLETSNGTSRLDIVPNNGLIRVVRP